MCRPSNFDTETDQIDGEESCLFHTMFLQTTENNNKSSISPLQLHRISSRKYRAFLILFFSIETSSLWISHVGLQHIVDPRLPLNL